LFAGQSAHFAVHDLLAAFTHAKPQAHDGIAVNARDSFN
jgi:hypothetical protein